MANPVLVLCTENQWTLVAENVVGGSIHKTLFDAEFSYFWTLRDTGGIPPSNADYTDGGLAQPIFKTNHKEEISRSIARDIYVWIVNTVDVTETTVNLIVIGNTTFEEVDTHIQNNHTTIIDLYAHIDKAFPVITVDTAIDDKSVVVDSIVDVAAGDVIVFYEADRVFQSIVSSAAVNTINFVSPLDYAFTTNGVIHVGTWNLAVNGSVTPQIAHIITPPDVKYDIFQVNASMMDNAVMDSSKFGSLTALTNGVVLRVINGITKNLALIVNNIGFSEQGFDTIYEPKPPAGVYGFQAKKNYPIVNGSVIRLDGHTNDELQCIIDGDDLTGLDMFNITISAHIVKK